MDEVKGQQGCWHCFWSTDAGTHPLLVLLTGTVVAKCLMRMPGKAPCPLQQVWSGEERCSRERKQALAGQVGLP